MVWPPLVDYVREEVEKEAKLQKALRLGREEREGTGRADPKHKVKNQKKDKKDE